MHAIEPNYPDDEVIEVIKFTSALATLTAVSLSEGIAQNNALAQEFLEKAKEMAT